MSHMALVLPPDFPIRAQGRYPASPILHTGEFPQPPTEHYRESKYPQRQVGNVGADRHRLGKVPVFLGAETTLQ